MENSITNIVTKVLRGVVGEEAKKQGSVVSLLLWFEFSHSY